MPYWNHRVVKAKYEDGSEYFSVREVHYNDDGTLYAWTVNPVDISGETLEEVRQYTEMVLKAFESPVLVDGEVTFINPFKDEDARLNNLSNNEYWGITYLKDGEEDWSQERLDAWKETECIKGNHLFDEVLSERHYLHCDACGFEENLDK